jgi:hypothetical protein
MTTSDAGEQRDIDAGVDQPGLSELSEAESPIYPLDGRQGRDRVDAQSEQSFPASDPPSWPGAAL